MAVSVIVPAHNAASTIGATLQSLCSQSLRSWEAIVVDDGSTDETAVIGAAFAERDSRIRVVRQTRQGESGARNAGIALSRFSCLMFLDADDWVLPQCLERQIAVLNSSPDADVAVCGWVHVTPDGTQFGPGLSPAVTEPFPLLGRVNPFAVHACVLRRRVVDGVQLFDTSLRTCADWDFWQRVARTGARFATTPEVLACYRVRPGSASSHPRQLLRDGLQVIARAYGRDPRVVAPDPKYAGGLPVDQLPSARLGFVSWPAGLMLGRGEDARPLLDLVHEEHAADLDPNCVAGLLFTAVPVAAARPPAAWPALWQRLQRPIRLYLHALERQSGTAGLAQSAGRILEYLIRQQSTGAGQRLRASILKMARRAGPRPAVP